MKNKKNLYILLPAVIVVWGLLIYKIIGGLNPSEKQAKATESIGQFKPKRPEQTTSFSINADYRDPFLGTFENKKRIVMKSKNAPIVQKVSVPFPSIVYKGIVSPIGKKEKVFLITVNGQQQMFKRSTVFNEVKLLNGNAREITVLFQKQKQTFQLEK